MVTNFERKLIVFLIKIRLFYGFIDMRLFWLVANPGARWVLRWIKKRQVVDDLHHAPCCPANHYHKMRLVFKPCNCGADFQKEVGKFFKLTQKY